MKKIVSNQIPEKNDVKVEDKEHYTEEFYQGMSIESLESARIYLTHLWKFIEPNSVQYIWELCGTLEVLHGQCIQS